MVRQKKKKKKKEDHKGLRFRSYLTPVIHNHNPVLSSFMTNHRVSNKSCEEHVEDVMVV